LKRRVVNGEKQIFVHYRHYPIRNLTAEK